jgi:hypothetical protein
MYVLLVPRTLIGSVQSARVLLSTRRVEEGDYRSKNKLCSSVSQSNLEYSTRRFGDRDFDVKILLFSI